MTAILNITNVECHGRKKKFSLANKKYQNVLREVTALESIMENEEGP